MSLHQLVQDVVRGRLDESTQETQVQQLIWAMVWAFPVGDFENWAQCDRFLSHALRLMEWRQQYGIETEAAAGLLNQTAYYLDELGLYSDAEPLFQEALELYKRLLGDDHPKVARSLNKSGETLRLTGPLQRRRTPL